MFVQRWFSDSFLLEYRNAIEFCIYWLSDYLIDPNILYFELHIEFWMFYVLLSGHLRIKTILFFLSNIYTFYFFCHIWSQGKVFKTLSLNMLLAIGFVFLPIPSSSVTFIFIKYIFYIYWDSHNAFFFLLSTW